MNMSIDAARKCDGALGSSMLFLGPRLDSLSHFGPIAWVYDERLNIIFHLLPRYDESISLRVTRTPPVQGT
jgi:hypothetical protein